MIIDLNYLLNAGLNISDEIDEEKLERAIFTAEQTVVKQRLGYDLYISILDAIEDEDPEYEVILNGGKLEDEERKVYISGLKIAEAHIAYSILLSGNINATSFGSTVKLNEEVSRPAGEEHLRRMCMQNMEIGLAYLKEITDWYKIDNRNKWLPNPIEEFI